MITTILRNLVSNAIKFSNKGTQIAIETSETTDEITTIIADHGIGMTLEEVDSLFNIDSKLQKEGTCGEKGSGLGLILCKEFIQKNNGKIAVQSTPNQGTLFIFALPKHVHSV